MAKAPKEITAQIGAAVFLPVAALDVGSTTGLSESNIGLAAVISSRAPALTAAKRPSGLWGASEDQAVPQNIWFVTVKDTARR